MFLLDLFRSFLPVRNPLGFGGTDFILLALAAALALLALLWRPVVEPMARALAGRTAWCMLVLAVLPVALRVLLLAHHPIPIPTVSDEFSHLLVADTLLHLRLVNPPHPLHQFFETFFVLQEPSYSSIYALGQGMVLALGRMLFGHPWAGVALATGALCSLCYWMLRAWTTPGWALAGGLLCVMQFGPLCQWMNSYWCGSVPAAAGCLVFGTLPRLRKNGRPRDAVLLGLGLALSLLTRPYESIFLVLSVLLFFLLWHRRFLKTLTVAALVVTPAIALTLAQNKQGTGSWTTLPYMLSRYQYGVPTTFTFEPNPVPHNPLTEAQQLYYNGQSQVHGDEPETLASYVDRLGSRAGFYRFFFLAPLLLVLPFFLPLLREFRYLWIALTFLMFALGTNFYPYFFSHYLAAETCLFVLVAILGLQRLSEWRIRGSEGGRLAVLAILALCATHFLFWYGVHVQGDEQILYPMTAFETAPGINFGDAEGRIAVEKRLAAEPGRQLVFVRYFTTHGYLEWIHNDADIDNARVVWALELNPEENAKLKSRYPDRKVWLMEPDAQPPKLVPYPASVGPFLTVE